MNTTQQSPGPVFVSVQPQPHPDRYVHDLGLQMQWHNHCVRLYRRVRKYAPYAFTFDDVFIHEEDAPESFVYHGYQIYQTKVGAFYSLSLYLAILYDRGEATRPIFDALADLDLRLPPDRQVTASDAAHFCKHRDTSEPPRSQPRPCHTGMLTPLFEDQGYRLIHLIREEQEGHAMVDIGWTPGSRRFFTGILELRSTEDGPSGHWRLPGPPGVNCLLLREFDRLLLDCRNHAQCFTPEGIQFCIGNGSGLQQLRHW